MTEHTVYPLSFDYFYFRWTDYNNPYSLSEITQVILNKIYSPYFLTVGNL